MNDADELARRCLALWAEYFKALLADPRTMGMVKRWISITGQFSYPASGAPPGDAGPSPAWPPVFSPFGTLPVPPLATGASAERGDGLADLTHRVAELEQRIAVLERPRRRRPARRRTASEND